MDKIYHLSNRTTLAIERSCEMLNYDDMFGSIERNRCGLEFELTEVFGPEFNNASPANTMSRSNISENGITVRTSLWIWVLKSYSNWNEGRKKWSMTNLFLVGLSV